jgi:peptidoglycan hydrolase-like protein with peptidoglycan-binding domain
MIHRTLGATLVALALAFTACSSGDPEASSKTMEARMKEIEKRMKDSMPKTQENALAQKVDEAVVKKVQTQLKALSEYLDEPSGKMNMVTVNAIEAFQRRERMKEDGLLNEETLKKLEAAAGKAGARPQG